MNQQKISYLLKGMSLITAVIGGVLFFWYFPLLIDQIGMMYDLSHLTMIGKCFVYGIACLCYMALFLFWKICTDIGERNSFCYENAHRMKIIGILAILVSLIILSGNVYLGILNYLSGPMLIVSSFSIFVGVGVSVLCYALSFLIQNATMIKEENDLTI